MYVNFTTLKIDPEKIEAFHKAIYNETTREILEETEGAKDSYLLHSLDQPGTVISVSTGESLEGMMKGMQSSKYAVIIEKIRPFLLAQPERQMFEIIDQIVKEEK